ncbi:MAG: DbpA RNA binding domain-containing protein, partial [Polaribacter sp.]|nr:DbpA RNA binding domain-containing protein [Polaribacter sp.]
RATADNMTRFFINIGRKDSLNAAKLIGLINDQNIGDKIEIGAIDILDTFSFFEIDKNFQEKTLEAFSSNQPDFDGRSVNVEITKKERSGGGSGSRRGGKKPFGNKDGGFGRRRSDDRGKRKSENRSSDRPDRNSGDRQSGGFGRRRRER